MDWEGSRYIDDRCSLFQKESGVLVDITALPGGYGIGEVGPHALKFLRLLKETKQKLWHIFSLRSNNAERLFAGTSYGWNIVLISFAWLRDDGLVSLEELQEFKEYIAQEDVRNNRSEILHLRLKLIKKVAKNFEKNASPELLAAEMCFEKYNHLWLEKFSLFEALNDELQKPWYQWPEDLRTFERSAVEMATKQLRTQIREKKVLQFLFARYWDRLRSEANYLGIRIILSIPVHVTHNSYEVWSHQDLFFTDERGAMTAVGGILPCVTFPHGKLFDGPQYRWNRIKSEQYKFWVNRFRRELQAVDIVALEHFHTLFECHEFPANVSIDAINHGRLVPTSDRELFDCVREILGTQNVIASDVFASNSKMNRALRQLEMANAVVIPFCFSSDKPSTQAFPKEYTQKDIVYTSNYFSPSLLYWLSNFSGKLTAEARSELHRCFGTDLNRVNRNGLTSLRESGAGAVMTTLQDILEIEQPSGDFLLWRFQWEQITDVIKTRLLQLSRRDNDRA